MKSGDLVGWNSRFGMDLPTGIGIVIELIPHEQRLNDPFLHWLVYFPERGLLRCREFDLKLIEQGV